MMKVVITGLTGFVGQNLVRYLTEKSSYTILPLRIRSGEFIKIYGDAYIHLAAKAHDVKGTTEHEVYYQANYQLTKELYDHFLNDVSASRFIYMSSVKAISDSPGNSIVDENMDSLVSNVYGQTKKMAEDYILSNSPKNGKRVYILRPCMIHGPNNKGNLNLLYQFVRKGIPYPLAAFNNERSFLSVENLCHVIHQILLRDDIQPGVYNVADSKPISTNRLIKLIGETLQRKTLMLSVPRILVKALAKIGDLFLLPINSHTLHKLTENYVVSNEKIVRALGHDLPIDSETGLKKTISSFIHAD